LSSTPIPLRLVMIDDEPLARERARRLLEKIGGAEVLREFANAQDALPYLEAEQPDVLLLDINMPGISGLRLIEALDDPPAIILATAHEEHALRAFELEVVDYLLKPYSAERLGKALDRVRKQVGSSQPAPEQHQEERLSRLAVDMGRGTILVPLDEIAGAIVEENVLFLLAADGDKYCHPGTLQQLEEQLPITFIRVSRAAMVNLRTVTRLTPGDAGLILTLTGNHQVQVSRRRARFLRERLKRGL